ncbi:hypothetical protein B0T18DRAFT_331684 [Schizothecium vesticola]|uniref:TauD/TfdA-like domain-containing protein n=1 Tax=Schizothecium vesticola TaxID=314040 RepID=A0AA40EH57_9PEZI|nr:hypothetical protein B0T18DRAFT_331684 [Schizothecium vesticola]
MSRLNIAMEFSARDLEDIQRVAGLLNLTVDELIQQRRASNQTAASHRHQSLAAHQFPAHEGPQQLSYGLGDRQNEVLPWQHAQASPFELMDVESLDFDEYTDQQPSVGSVTSPVLEAAGAGPDVILLNPQAVWYDCDAAMWSLDEGTADNLLPGDDSVPEGDGTESFVAVTPVKMDVDEEMESNPMEEGRKKGAESSSGTDWAMVSSSPGSLSPFQTPFSPTAGPAEKRYHPIAPKSGRSTSQSTSQSSSSKVRKKRSPYQGAKKKDTHLTRQVHACVRCRMQRNRCVPDPTNPRGPCLTCQQKTVRMSRLPCLRYMVTDSTLFRTSLDYMPFYRAHPMVGPQHGDFHLERRWTGSASKILCLGQLQVPLYFKVELRQFVPPANNDLDLKGRPMYAVPWAVADADAVVLAINNYIDRGITQYLYEYLDDTNGLVWDIFQQAYRASVFPIPNRMLQKALRLWVACRFIESKWRCWADSGWEDSEIRAATPKDPFWDWDSLPPYLDYQIASIVIHRVLGPLRKDVLRELQGTFNTHSPKDWYVTFLTSFILLQNYELQMSFQRQFALRRQAQQLFTKAFDWQAPKVRRMARLDPEQTSFMAQCRDLVVERGDWAGWPDSDEIIGDWAVAAPPVPPAHGWSSMQLKGGVAVTTKWPVQVQGSLCWEPTAMGGGEQCTLALDTEEVGEVRSAVRFFNGLGLYGSDVSPSTFPLPTLGPRLLGLALAVHSGRGFALVRGLDPDDFSQEDNVVIFLGISSYIGPKRGRQDEEGNMLMHIRDAQLSRARQEDRPIRYSARASTFHTDTFCDILSLQTRNLAVEGGRNLLSSSWTIYNKLKASRPDVVELLAQPIWPFDSRGRFFESSTRPLLFFHGGRIMMNLAREPLLGLEGVTRAAGLPVLSPAQREALDLVERVATENQITLDAERGDMLFINNHAILHSREAFTPGARRYLVRAWLKNPALAWKLPRALQEGNSRIYDDNELGERWNIADVPKIAFRLSERLTS